MDRIKLIQLIINHIKATSYLEIGCEADNCVSNIVCETKVGVDPVSGGTHRMTSDSYFAQNPSAKFDVIFIDGLHWSEQVMRDITHSLFALTPKGVIVLHDCNPPAEETACYPRGNQFIWNGDCFKAVLYYRQIAHLDIVVSDFDWGCGIIQQKPNTDILTLPKPYHQITYQDLEANRKKWLRISSFDEICKWLAPK